MDFSDPQVLELINSNLPVVTIDHVFNNRMSVLSDNVQGLEALVRYAYVNGHRKLAFIHGERTTVTENRLTGFYRACEALGVSIDDTLVRESRYHDAKRCAQITKELMELPDRPTCVIFTYGIGRAAAKGLIDLIERPRTTLTDRVVVPGHIRVRESVAKIGK